MIIFHPSQALLRRQQIGKTEFVVNAYFCGFESIYQKLADLMESELEAEQSIATAENILIDNGPA